MPAAIAYTRVSTTDQAEEGASLAAQLARIHAWATMTGSEVVAEFEDAGLSGRRADNRPGLQAAISEACRRKAPLVVYSLSRFARSTVDAVTIAKRLERCGAPLVSLSESIDTTTAAGKLVFRLLASLAEGEVDFISERTCLAMNHLRRCGRRISGCVPYGFDLAPDGRMLVPNPAERSAIIRMRALRDRGLSFPAIADELHAAGIPTKSGRDRWNPKVVRRVLRRAALMTPKL